MNIKWNNSTLFSKGIVVEKVPVITKAKKRYKTYDVEGRNGNLVIDEGTYDTFVCSLTCHFNTSYSIDEIKSFLDGYGVLSLDGVREYQAIVDNQIDFEDIDRSGFKKFLIQFLCQPIAHEIDSSIYNIVGVNPARMNIEQTANAYPVLTIKGSGDVTITFNGKQFNLYGLESTKTYTLDCEAKEIYDNNGNNCSNMMRYDFPYIIPGFNEITYTGTLTQFKIEFHKAFI